MWPGLKTQSEGRFPFIKVDWRKVATRKFWQSRNGRPSAGSTGPWSSARTDTGDEAHYSCRCQSSRFIILSSTAAKLAPRVSKWVGSSEGDDRKEPEGLSWHPSKCSIKGKQREHCNFFCFKFKEHKESHNNVNLAYHCDGQKGCELDLYTPATLFDFYRNYSFR